MKKIVVVSILIVAVVFGLVAFAAADQAILVPSGNPLEASGNVTVHALVNPRLAVTIDTTDASQTLEFGTLDVGDDPGAKEVDIVVSSNKPFTIDKAVNAGITSLVSELGMTMDWAAGTAVASGPKGADQAFNDTYTIPVIDYDVTPGDYTGIVTYTVTQ